MTMFLLYQKMSFQWLWRDIKKWFWWRRFYLEHWWNMTRIKIKYWRLYG